MSSKKQTPAASTLLQLEFSNQRATLNHVSFRKEVHGQDKVLCADLKVQAHCMSDVLAFFHPALASMLFDLKAPKDLADGSPLRFTKLLPLAFDHEMSGAEFSLNVGVGNPIKFTDAVLKNFVVEPKDGGGVFVHFKVAVKPTDEQCGVIAPLMQQEIEISLTPAELPSMGDGDGDE